MIIAMDVGMNIIHMYYSHTSIATARIIHVLQDKSAQPLSMVLTESVPCPVQECLAGMDGFCLICVEGFASEAWPLQGSCVRGMKERANSPPSGGGGSVVHKCTSGQVSEH